MRLPDLRATTALALLIGSVAQASETITYSYDARGRLTQVAHSGTINTGVTTSYSFDKADNRLSKATAGAGSGGVAFTIASNGAVTEGANSIFTITKTGTASGTLTVNYATADATAASGSDFTSTSGTLSFLAGETSKQVTVPTADDSTAEAAETFTMALSSPSAGGSLGSPNSATATINDNDSAPACSGVTFSVASDGAVTEGTSAGFTISKAGTATGSCTIDYATADGSAVAGSDYSATSGTVTFLAGDASKSVTVTTIDDSSVESPETFSLAVSNPTGGAAVGSPASATSTINDNDGAVSFSISDASALEGDQLQFTVTRSGPATGSYSVNYATANGTAGAGDYTAASGTLTFAAGVTAQTVLVWTSTDSLSGESDETMFVNLSGATGGATIADPQGVGTIVNVDNGCSNPRTC